MKFSPSLDAIFRNTDLTLDDKLRIVRQIGFEAFEIWGWWNRDMEELRQVKDKYELTLASMCTRMVSLVNPNLRGQYVEGLQESLDVARRLNCSFLISQTGNLMPDVPREAQRESLVAGLRGVAPYLEEAGVTLIVEPLNTKVDHKGYFLERSDEAFEIINAVNSPAVKIVYDIYHQQISEGNLIPTITSNMDKIAYFHAADHPGRHEPGTGEIHYTNVFNAIKNTGYKGYIGLEYIPLMDADQSLSNVMEEYVRRLDV